MKITFTLTRLYSILYIDTRSHLIWYIKELIKKDIVIINFSWFCHFHHKSLFFNILIFNILHFCHFSHTIKFFCIVLWVSRNGSKLASIHIVEGSDAIIRVILKEILCQVCVYNTMTKSDWFTRQEVAKENKKKRTRKQFAQETLNTMEN